MRRLLRALLVLLALLAAGWLGRGPLLEAVGSFLVQDDPLVSADAIVILGGDPRHRAPHGAALYAQGVAPVLLAVGGTEADGRYSQAYLTTGILRRNGVPEDRILLSGQYEPSTQQEARATADYAQDRGWSRVVVVTSPYHTWRAKKIFREQLAPMGVDVRVSAAPQDPYDPASWWKDDRQRRQVRNEYLKYLAWRFSER